MLNIAVAVSTAFLLLSGVCAVPFERRATNGVIRQCTTPNTVALTFVRLPPVQLSPPLYS